LRAVGHLAGWWAYYRAKGPTSWIDPTIKPADAAVRFKLMMYEEGIFFGAREEWANSLGIALATIGSDLRAPSPSTVEFRGDFVKNDAAEGGAWWHSERLQNFPRRRGAVLPHF
jgi:hypothetical protein